MSRRAGQSCAAPRDMTAALCEPRARSAFRKALLRWYGMHARSLPWRRTTDPYHVWLSEMLLQQTRVESAVGYYARFVAAFPNVETLARADIDDVLRVWQGLGYYRRARHLHAAARVIVDERSGRFPTTAAEWEHLPGIGRYTAGAIASIAFGQRVPAVDGNVQRVLTRLFAIRDAVDAPDTRAALWQHAASLVSRTRPGDFNQAMMELGATICLPRSPACGTCPVRTWCAAREQDLQATLPVRPRRAEVPVVRAAAAYVERDGRFLLVKRPPRGLLGGFWTLPACEVEVGARPAVVLRAHLRTAFGLTCLTEKRGEGQVTHDFTHRRLVTYVMRFEAGARPPRQARGSARWVLRAELDRYPLATLDRKLLAAALGQAR